MQIEVLTTNKPRVAWFTTNQSDSRSWYLWEKCGASLKDRFEITLFGDKEEKELGIKSYLCAYKEHQTKPFDIFVYNLEDTKESYFSRFALGLIPGVVIFHDFLLLTDGPEPIHNSAWATIRAKFLDEAAWPIRNTSHDRLGPWASRESAYALGALFFSPWSHQEWLGKKQRGLIEDRESSSLWYPAEIQNQSTERAGVAFCGRPSVEDRAVSVLRAIKESKEKLLWLVRESDLGKAKEYIKDERLTLGKDVELVSGLTPAKWKEIVSKSTIALHPRMSVYGDVGPYLEISLASGAFVVVSDFGKSSYLPDSAVIKVSTGITESAEIASALIQTKEARKAKAILLKDTATFAQENLAPEIVAGEVVSFINKLIPTSKKFLGEWQGFEDEARESVLSDAWDGWNFSDEIVKGALKPSFDELFK